MTEHRSSNPKVRRRSFLDTMPARALPIHTCVTRSSTSSGPGVARRACLPRASPLSTKVLSARRLPAMVPPPSSPCRRSIPFAMTLCGAVDPIARCGRIRCSLASDQVLSSLCLLSLPAPSHRTFLHRQGEQFSIARLVVASEYPEAAIRESSASVPPQNVTPTSSNNLSK